MFDLIVVGGGPGGSCCATYVAQAGFNVLLIEKEEFPRFKIGESLLPYSMEIFNDIGFDQVLASGKYLKKEGALFVDTEVTNQAYFDFSDKGKAKHAFAYEVERSVFDKDLLDFAIESGVTVKQPEVFVDCIFKDGFIEVKTNKGIYNSRFIVDGSGASSVIANKFGSKPINPFYDNNFAVYTHYENLTRDFQRKEGDITIGILKNQSWSWIIPFVGNKTSVGLVVNKEELSKINNFAKLFETKTKENPWLHEILQSGTQILDFKIASNYSKAPNVFVGKNWGALGDASSFLDPVFSSGVHVALMSAKLLSHNIIFTLNLGSSGLDSKDEDQMYDYDKMMRTGVSRFHNLLQIFYNGGFVSKVNALESREKTMSMMTSAVAGGMWDEDNTLFRTGML